MVRLKCSNKFPNFSCSFAANYHLNFPRPAPIWPCISVGRATVICSRGRRFESRQGQRFFLFTPCEPISFLGLPLRRYYLGYLLEHFNLPNLNHYICLIVISGQTLQVTSFTCLLQFAQRLYVQLHIFFSVFFFSFCEDIQYTLIIGSFYLIKR